MQLRVDRLREALELLQPVVPRKSSLPVCANVLLKDGQAIATDLETAAILELPDAEGELVIPHSPVAKLLKYVPGGEMVALERKGKTLELSWQGGKASYEAADPTDYPPVPEVKAGAEGSLDGDTLVPALVSAAEYCATDDTRPVLSGVSLTLGDALEVAAGDGFRMAYQVLPIAFPSDHTVIVPIRAVHILEHLWRRVPPAPPPADSLVHLVTGKRQLELTLASGLLKAQFGRVALIARLIQGTPPSFRLLVPEETALKVQVFAPELERAVRRLQEVAKDGSGIVRLVWNESAMTVSAKSDDKGEVEAQVPVLTESGNGRVALSVGYLLDYLRGRQGMVTMGLKDDKSPVLFRHGTSPLVLIMPMFVQGPDQAAAPQAVTQAEETAAEADTDEPVEGEGSAPEQEAHAEPHPPARHGLAGGPARPRRKRKTNRA